MYFYPEKPKLISINQPLFQKLSDDPGWVAEPKYNGSRLVLMIDGDKIEFWNRHGQQFGYKPDKNLRESLQEFASHTTGFCMFDGELRHNKVKGISHKIVLWDTFVWDGEILQSEYLLRQTNLINTCLCLTIGQAKHLSLCSQHMESFRDLFNQWTKDPEIEGLVIKNLNGKLNLSRTAGQPSNWMFKVRRPNNSYRF
jgi:ATP-dependent DNA ligase